MVLGGLELREIFQVGSHLLLHWRTLGSLRCPDCPSLHYAEAVVHHQCPVVVQHALESVQSGYDDCLTRNRGPVVVSGFWFGVFVGLVIGVLVTNVVALFCATGRRAGARTAAGAARSPDKVATSPPSSRRGPTTPAQLKLRDVTGH